MCKTIAWKTRSLERKIVEIEKSPILQSANRDNLLNILLIAGYYLGSFIFLCGGALVSAALYNIKE